MRCPRCRHRLPLRQALGGAGDEIACPRCGAWSQVQPWPLLTSVAVAGTTLVSAATIGIPAWIGAPVLIGGLVTWIYTRTPVSCLPVEGARELLPPAQARRRQRRR